MTQQQKLEKIIEYAVEQGFEDGEMYLKMLKGDKAVIAKHPEDKKFEDMAIMLFEFGVTRMVKHELLFNHDFAKAVFGEGGEFVHESEDRGCGWPVEDLGDGDYDCHIHGVISKDEVVFKKDWEEKLQQLAITPEEERINYIFNTIKEEL